MAQDTSIQILTVVVEEIIYLNDGPKVNIMNDVGETQLLFLKRNCCFWSEQKSEKSKLKILAVELVLH